MGVIIFAVIWYCLWGKNNPKVYNRMQIKKNKSILRWVILGLIVTSFGFDELLIPLLVLAGIVAPFLVIGKLIQNANESGRRRSNPDYQAIYRAEKKDFTLTKDVRKRTKIVKKFNDKYDLNLSEEQIRRIVESSYVNYYWEKEIYDMTKDYAIPLEWYQGDSAWLRVYLKAFPSMNISSDFATQFEICEREFRKILDETEMSRYYSIDDCIEDVNRRYNLWFDEQTFTMMLRYMADRGYPVRIPTQADYKYESEMDRLVNKYDQAEQAQRGSRKKEAEPVYESEMDRLARKYDASSEDEDGYEYDDEGYDDYGSRGY